ncbi:MAG: hypothetical protein JST39_16840 [Bacteroidetes bacterium]|nr:hypothetical protein [Bacteroidota bacterium]
MFQNILISIVIACGIIGIATFILYARARMKEDEQKEQFYLRIHYAALFIVLILGLIYLFYMVETAT